MALTTYAMKKIKRDNAGIEYEISGSGEYTLLFVHGSYIDQSYWETQVDYFSNSYSVVTIDLPGHGKSGHDRKHWSVQGFALDLVEVIEQLKLKNVILIGHSLGANVNLIAATYAPSLIIGFISIDNFKNAATPLPAHYDDHIKQILQQLKNDFAGTNEQYVRLGLITENTPAQICEQVIGDYRTAHRPMGIELMPEFFKMSELERELLPLMKFKIHLINVDYLPVNEQPLKLHAAYGYDVQHMDGTCHFPMLENPDRLNSLLRNAIEKVTKSIIVWPHQHQN